MHIAKRKLMKNFHNLPLIFATDLLTVEVTH